MFKITIFKLVDDSNKNNKVAKYNNIKLNFLMNVMELY